MKKTLIAVLAAVSLLFAESYQVNTLSAKQMGMAHTGAGIKLGSESMHFNPGGLGFLSKTLDISAGATIIIPEVEFRGVYGKAVNDKIGTPFYFYAASNITDWFSAGLSFTTPYGNSAYYGKGWEGAGLLQDISLATYALQPTVAFKPIEQLSIGAGPVVYFGSFEQSKRLFIPLNIYSTPWVSGTFSGNADVAVAVNAGILYDILQDKLALGVAYRDKAKMKVAKGNTKVEYAPEFMQSMIDTVFFNQYFPLLLLDQKTFKAELPLPANLNTGVSFRPIENLLLAFDWQIVFWGTYKELALEFDNPMFNMVSQKKYHNTFAYRLGAQYALIDQLDVRLGVYYDESPVDDDYLTPESPSTDKLGCTMGLSYRPIPSLSIDASLLFATSLGSRSATSNSNPEKTDGLDGRYKVMAWVPSVGLSYSF